MKKKRARRAPKKIHLIFDEDERRDFLTGFQKRKKERQKKAQEELKARVLEEKRRLRAEKREVLQKLLEDRPLPCSEDDGEPVTYDMADHTVTVTSLDSGQQFLADRLDEAVKEGRSVDSHKRRLKALDHKMGQCSRPMAKRKKGPKKRRRQ
uniref:Nucleolar protein 12 n=1 Tax=Ixodes ricinus TaxID=34613 RepID=V5IJY0_IXORI